MERCHKATQITVVPKINHKTSQSVVSSMTTISKLAAVDETVLVNQLDIEEVFSVTAAENSSVVDSHVIEPETGEITVYQVNFGQPAVEGLTAINSVTRAENELKLNG